jgi:putative transposase
MLRFRGIRTLQKLASVHALVRNCFLTEREFQNRDACKLAGAAALAEWRGLLAA